MPASSYPYNFSDFSGDMHGDLKPSNHMDIPAGELHLLCDADSTPPLMQISHYHSLRNVKTFSRSPAKVQVFSCSKRGRKKDFLRSLTQFKLKSSQFEFESLLETTYQFSKRMEHDLTSSVRLKMKLFLSNQTARQWRTTTRAREQVEVILFVCLRDSDFTDLRKVARDHENIYIRTNCFRCVNGGGRPTQAHTPSN